MPFWTLFRIDLVVPDCCETDTTLSSNIETKHKKTVNSQEGGEIAAMGYDEGVLEAPESVGHQ